MKRIVFSIFLIITAFSGYGQYPSPIFTKSNNSYGQRLNRLEPDSTLFLPTGCGRPMDTTWLFSQQNNGNGEKPEKVAIYADTCGMHLYWFNPTNDAWLRIDTGSNGTDSTTLTGLWVKRSATGTIITIYADSAAMAGYFLRRVDSGVNYVTPTQLGKKLDTASAHFNLYVKRQGQPGDTALTASDTTLHSAAQRDSLQAHHTVNPDGSWTWYTNIYDTTSANALETEYGADTSIMRVNNALAAKVVNAGASKSIQAGPLSSRPTASNCQCYWFSTTDSTWSYDNGGWISVKGGTGGNVPLVNRGTGYRLAEPADSINTIYNWDGIGIDSATNKGLTIQNLAMTHRLEFIDTVATTTYQNDNLIGAALTYVSDEDVPIGRIPRSTAYYTFNSTTGTITLVNASFNVNDKVQIIYRGPYINTQGTSIIGTVASANSFPDLSLFTTDSPAAAFSSSNNRIVMRSFNVGSMWGDGGDCLHYNLYTNDEQIYYENDIKISAQGDGYGFAVMWGSGPSLYSTYSSIFANASLINLSAPKLIMWQGGSPGTEIDSVPFPTAIAVGDTIRLRLTRNKGQFTGTMTDLRTGSTVSDVINFSYTYPRNFDIPRTYKWGTAKFGTGVDSLIRVSLVSQSLVHPKVIFIGDSKTAGLFAGSSSLRYSELTGANSAYSPFAVYASNADRTYDCLHAIDYIITYVRPKYAFVNIGRNDGMPFSSSAQTNYETIVSRLEGSGIKVINLGPIPETGIPDQSTLSNFITATYGTANFIDLSTGWVNGTMLSTDGVHPNTLGNSNTSTNILNAAKIH